MTLSRPTLAPRACARTRGRLAVHQLAPGATRPTRTARRQTSNDAGRWPPQSAASISIIISGPCSKLWPKTLPLLPVAFFQVVSDEDPSPQTIQHAPPRSADTNRCPLLSKHGIPNEPQSKIITKRLYRGLDTRLLHGIFREY